jgi:hypothetical protein
MNETKNANFDGNIEGHMLPTNLESGPTSEQRTDAEIDAALKAVNKAQYNYNSFRGKDKTETYAEYVKRVDGLVDFVVLTEEQWRKETGQLTASQQILADLGLPPTGKEGPMTDEEVAQLNDLLGLNPPAMFGGELPDTESTVGLIVETKHYSDGSSATGVAPLPDQSPEQQEQNTQSNS